MHTEKLAETKPEIILNSPFNIDLIEKLNGYLFHGTDVPFGILEDRKFRVNESLDDEGAVYFHTQFSKCGAIYGDYIIAIPIPDGYEIFRNDDGNEYENTSVKICEDVQIFDDTMIYYGKWYTIDEFLMEFEEEIY